MESLLFNRENFSKHVQAYSLVGFFNKGKAYQLIFSSILSKILRPLYINTNQIRSGRNTIFFLYCLVVNQISIMLFCCC